MIFKRILLQCTYMNLLFIYAYNIVWLIVGVIIYSVQKHNKYVIYL